MKEEKRKCTFCNEYIADDKELTYTEDSEPCHEKCLKDFEEFWDKRDEFFDLMGW